tara:strand:+ start:1600 stop:1866 length:267 start_codon:yes stop_codon:yes gene_type:complete
MTNKDKEKIQQGTTCFNEHKKYEVPCAKKDCKYWIDVKDCVNCTMVMASDGPRTLQEIGELFGVTRMRICQIEKSVMNKLRTKNKINY